ncbi:LysR family transcriptional regulator [Variovorax sp. ZS18.2.2]|uniref:LysR family transcriptional regulator n=1 Tax=Variovorax sp. ZS18.2.2 TaxID=2971255 RepID=UPI0021509A99|nr:LysR family transcriptional regulator [Variovorax sp. ZS18.2.2]MCR6479812.1 LysR family transcriptional regulator [Variovorax sp. ZS18.2.2]
MPELADMKLFVQTVTTGSLSAAGRELGFSPAVGSKRLARLEAALGTRLLHRSSRRLALTDEGAIYFERCQVILADVDEAEAAIGHGSKEPRGVLRVSSPVALGRRWVGPAMARFALDNPGVSVQLSLSDSVVDLIEGGFDCAVRIGGSEDSRLVVRPLASNRRVVCAAPAYLARREPPQTPVDLAAHDCIVMTRSASGHADWSFRPIDRSSDALTTVRVRGHMVTDNGEQAHDWALAGLGLVRRSVWDVAAELADGRLIEVMSAWMGESVPIQVVFASRRFLPVRTRQFVDLLVAQFAHGQAPQALLAPGNKRNEKSPK